MNGNNVNGNDPNGNDPQHDPEWSFSTSLRKSDVIDMKIQNELANGNTPIVKENMSTDDQPNGARLHKQSGGGYHDPTQQHNIVISSNNNSDEKIDTIPVGTKKMRNYHVSFSESESMADLDGTQTPVNQGSDGSNGNNNASFQINRFKVEYGSRLSESGTVATQIEPSLSDTNFDPVDNNHDLSDDEDGNSNMGADQGPDSQNSANNEKTQQIKRFFVTPAKPEVSADECDDPNINGVNKSPPQQPIAHQQEQQQQPQQKQSPIQNVVQQPQQQPPPQQLQQNQQQPAISQPEETEKKEKKEKWEPPSTAKADWDSELCSQWVGNLGAVYKQYTQAFVDNGIDGEFFAELDDAILAEIVPSALHRKKILSAWDKLQKK